MRKGRYEEERETEKESERERKREQSRQDFSQIYIRSSKYSRLSCLISFSILRIFLSFHYRDDNYQLDNFVFHYHLYIYIYHKC